MKEIKAYVRRSMAPFVIEALVSSGCRDFSAANVRGLARELPPKDLRYADELGENYAPIVKIEIVCRDESAPRLIDVIRSSAHTGETGDGVIFVARIDEAIRIRDGERGAEALLL